jgi:hypothetical protein
MSDLLLIRSKDRTANSANSHNFQLDLKNYSIEPGTFNIEFINMQNTAYTIRADVNTTIYFTENATAKTAAVAVGYYTESTLPAAIKSALDTASGGFATFTVTISSSTKRLNISSTQSFSLTFGTNTNASIAKTLGFPASNTGAATSHTASYVVNLSDPLSANIRIHQATAGGFRCLGGAWGQILVPLDVQFGYFKAYTTKDFPQTLKFNSKSNKLDIEVRDVEGNMLDLNGSEFEMLLRRI